MRPSEPRPYVALTIAVIAISSSAPLIAYATAPALAIAFWRNAMAVTLLAPTAAVRRRAEIAALGRHTVLLCALAGLALAVHFATWIPSAKLTSVTAATALVSTTPVWTALISVLRGVHVPGTTWLGIGIAVAGAALTTGADLGVSGRAVAGDLLALAGGLAAGFYTVLGERVRASTSTTTYTTICYAVCAVGLGAACLAGGVPLSGWSATAWLLIVAMTVGPQLLGHSLINYAVQHVPATTISVLLLLEVPGAALLGWLILRQLPAPRSLPGLVVLVSGVAVVMLGARRRRNGQPTNGGTAISPEAIGTT